MLKIDHLVKNYNTFSLDCSLEVLPGQITGLVGKNGAGKSTIFHAVLGLIRPDSGKITVLGKDSQENVTGEVKFKLYKGNIIKAGTTSPYSLYNESIASFKTGDLYDHHDADGFINLFGLSLKVRAMKEQELSKKNNK